MSAFKSTSRGQSTTQGFLRVLAIAWTTCLIVSGCNPPPTPTVPKEEKPTVPGVTTPPTAATPPTETSSTEPAKSPQVVATPPVEPKAESNKLAPADATPPVAKAPATEEKATSTKEKEGDWKDLFDGKTLSGWEVTDFGGQGDVEVKDDAIVMEMGSEMTGITWKREFPRVNFEVSLEAKRINGSDFFCGVIFPVEKSPCSLVLGGWGGSVVGLSSIDGQYAVDNETAHIMSFDNDKWYRVRLKVTKDKIQVWIDDEQVVDLKTEGHEVSIHPSVEISQPFGLCCYATKAAARKIRLRSFDPAKEPADEPAKKKDAPEKKEDK